MQEPIQLEETLRQETTLIRRRGGGHLGIGDGRRRGEAFAADALRFDHQCTSSRRQPGDQGMGYHSHDCEAARAAKTSRQSFS